MDDARETSGNPQVSPEGPGGERRAAAQRGGRTGSASRADGGSSETPCPAGDAGRPAGEDHLTARASTADGVPGDGHRSTDGPAPTDSHGSTDGPAPTGDPAPSPVRARSLTGQILGLAVPALGALVAEPLFVIIDSAMVGHLGTPELAGLALASTVLQTVVGVFVFLAYSTTALAARALGAGHPDRAVRSGIEAMWLAAGLGVVAAVALVVTGPALVNALGADPAVAPHAVAYLRASSPGLVGMFVVLAATGTLRGLLDTRTPLVVAAGGAAFNVAANAVLIYGAGLGIAGSGAGTAVTQTLMAVALVWVVVRGARGLGVSLRPSAGGVWGAAVDGAPLLVRTVALRVALLATLAVATAAGTQALAAHQVVNAVWNLTGFVMDALAIAAQALVGYALGAGDVTRLRDLLRRLALWGLGSGAVLGVVVAAASAWIPLAFGSDPDMHHIATAALLTAAVFLPLAGLVFLLDGVLIGASQGRYLAVAGVVTLAVYLPGLWALLQWVHAAGTLDVAGQTRAMVWLWACFGGLFLASRGACNAWRTWWSPRHALVPRTR